MGSHSFEIRFDFISHDLRILKSDGASRDLPLQPQSVADVLSRGDAGAARVAAAGEDRRLPNEIADPIPFDRDETIAPTIPGTQTASGASCFNPIAF